LVSFRRFVPSSTVPSPDSVTISIPASAEAMSKVPATSTDEDAAIEPPSAMNRVVPSAMLVAPV